MRLSLITLFTILAGLLLITLTGKDSTCLYVAAHYFPLCGCQCGVDPMTSMASWTDPLCLASRFNWEDCELNR